MLVIADLYAGGPDQPACCAASRWSAIGRISYGLYLWHWPVFLVLNGGRIHWAFVPLTLLRLAVSVAGGRAVVLAGRAALPAPQARLEPPGGSRTDFDPRSAASLRRLDPGLTA